MKSSNGSMFTVFLPLILFFVIMYIFLLRPQRKKDKETRDMRNNLSPGDSVVTIGGIVGTVLSVKDENVVLYVGSGKVKMEFKKWAIASVDKKSPNASKKAEKEEPAKSTKRLKKKPDVEPAVEEFESDAAAAVEETAAEAAEEAVSSEESVLE